MTSESWRRADGTTVEVERFERLSGYLLLTDAVGDPPILRLDPKDPETDLPLCPADCRITIDGAMLAVYTLADGTRYIDECPETLGYERSP